MLLDALTYIIDADNRKLDAEIQGSEKKVDDLGKSMTVAEKRASDMQKRMTDGFKRLGGALVAAFAVSKIMGGLNELAQTAESVRNTSNAIGVAVEDVDAFGKSMELMGGDAQGARDSLTDMAESIGEAMADVDSGRAKTFRALGISLKDVTGQTKNAAEVMSELAGAVEGMSREQAVFRIKELGITDNRTVELLLKGRQELDRMMRVQKEQGVITQETTERAQKYTEAMAKFRQGTQGAMQGVASIALPILTKMLGGFSAVLQWMNRHGDFIKGFFIALSVILAVSYGPAVISAAVATWALIAPFVAVGVAVAAVAAGFALLYDDIVNFMEGNDSLIGQISETYPAVGKIAETMYRNVSGVFKLLTGDIEGASEEFSKAIDSIKEAFPGISATVEEVFGELRDVYRQGLHAAANLGVGLASIFDAMSSGVKGIFKGMSDFVKGIWEWIEKTYNKTVGMVSSMGGWLGEKLGFGGGDNGAGVALATASANPLNSATANTISNSASNNVENNLSIGELNVSTQATDANGVAQNIRSELRDALKDVHQDSASAYVK